MKGGRDIQPLNTSRIITTTPEENRMEIVDENQNYERLFVLGFEKLC